MPLSIDALNALTKKKWIEELVDNIFNSTPLLRRLRENQETWDGGPKIVAPVIYSEMANVTSFSGFDAVTRDEGEHKTAAEFDPKYVVAPVTVAKAHSALSQGPQKVIDFVKARLKVAELTMQKKLTTQIFSNGTGNLGKDITGLLAAVSNTGVYGGIDRATYTWWQAKVFANGGQARPLTTRLMRQAFIQCSDGDDKPDLIVTTDELWAQYAEIGGAEAMVVTQPVQRLLDLGFQTLNFMGAPVVPDKACPAGHMFFLNTKYLKLYTLKGWDMAHTPWREAEGKVALIMEILWGGNLVCNQPRRQAVIKDLDETNYA